MNISTLDLIFLRLGGKGNQYGDSNLLFFFPIFGKIPTTGNVIGVQVGVIDYRY